VRRRSFSRRPFFGGSARASRHSGGGNRDTGHMDAVRIACTKPLLLRESKRGRLPPVESRNCSPRNRRHGRPRDILLTPQMRRVNNIRLGADAGNPLSRSRNSRADGDGCIGFACRCRGDVLNGMTVRTVGSEPRRGSLSDRVLKPLHPSNAGDGSLRSRL